MKREPLYLVRNEYGRIDVQRDETGVSLWFTELRSIDLRYLRFTRLLRLTRPVALRVMLASRAKSARKLFAKNNNRGGILIATTRARLQTETKYVWFCESLFRDATGLDLPVGITPIYVVVGR